MLGRAARFQESCLLFEVLLYSLSCLPHLHTLPCQRPLQLVVYASSEALLDCDHLVKGQRKCAIPFFCARPPLAQKSQLGAQNAKFELKAPELHSSCPAPVLPVRGSSRWRKAHWQEGRRAPRGPSWAHFDGLGSFMYLKLSTAS